MTIIRIEAPHFVAAVCAENHKVTVAAPILKYMLGWSPGAVAEYAASKGWKLVSIAT